MAAGNATDVVSKPRSKRAAFKNAPVRRSRTALFASPNDLATSVLD